MRKIVLIAGAMMIAGHAATALQAPAMTPIDALLYAANPVPIPTIEARCAASPSGGFDPRYADVPQLAQRACVASERLAATRLNMMLPFLVTALPGRVAMCLHEVDNFHADPALYEAMNRCVANG